jgi:hypothetical protein
MDYVCRAVGGDLCAADDASKVAWFTEAELAGLKVTDGTPGVIAKAFRHVRENGSSGST